MTLFNFLELAKRHLLMYICAAQLSPPWSLARFHRCPWSWRQLLAWPRCVCGSGVSSGSSWTAKPPCPSSNIAGETKTFGKCHAIHKIKYWMDKGEMIRPHFYSAKPLMRDCPLWKSLETQNAPSRCSSVRCSTVKEQDVKSLVSPAYIHCAFSPQHLLQTWIFLHIMEHLLKVMSSYLQMKRTN